MSNQVLADGSQFGRFEIRSRLGKGGMGEVYRAFDTQRRGEVALKVLSAQFATDEVFLERFRREAQAAVDLRDPYVLTVHDTGEIEGRLFISMPLVEGRDLAAVLADGPLPSARAVVILRQAAHALSAAHQVGLVHRDVKPSNLLVVENRDDFTYLVDFGIAHVVGKHTVATSLTSTGATIGTLAYMAPERLQGNRDIDGRVDVYALACVLFEMLAGRAPYDMTDHASLMAAHLFNPIPAITAARPDLSPVWDTVISRGMAKDPAERYRSAKELAEDARAVLEGRGVAAATKVPRAIPANQPPPPPPTYVPQGAYRQPSAPPPGHGRYVTQPAPAPRRSGGGMVAAAASIAVVALATTVVWLTAQGSGNSSSTLDDRTSTPATSTASAPPSTSDGYIAGPVEAAGQPTLNGGPPVQPPTSGDLGLSRSIARVPCSGQYAVMVGASVDPARYRSEIQGHLNAHPGANYLLAEQNCSSLRQSKNGASIYSVYYGPYPTLAQACSARATAGGDAYVRVLDQSTPVGYEPPC